jgi:hypothetical protein
LGKQGCGEQAEQEEAEAGGKAVHGKNFGAGDVRYGRKTRRKALEYRHWIKFFTDTLDKAGITFIFALLPYIIE